MNTITTRQALSTALMQECVGACSKVPEQTALRVEEAELKIGELALAGDALETSLLHNANPRVKYALQIIDLEIDYLRKGVHK